MVLRHTVYSNLGARSGVKVAVKLHNHAIHIQLDASHWPSRHLSQSVSPTIVMLKNRCHGVTVWTQMLKASDFLDQIENTFSRK